MKIAYRKVGRIDIYSGSDYTSQGWFDEFDGKWVYLSLDSIRTIGNASSGAHIAQSWCQTLFTHWWTQYNNTVCPVLDSGGNSVTRGSTAANDWSANRQITMPDYRGRTIATAGLGSGLTSRSKGASTGEEAHTLTINEMPAHDHYDRYISALGTGTTGYAGTSGTLGQSFKTFQTGGGAAHNNLQPTWFEHLIISAGAR